MIKYPKKFEEAKPAGFDGMFDWDFLKPAFAPTKIEPMDFDAVVERYRKFLIFETKDEGVPISDGQRITLESAVMSGLATVVICRKRPAEIHGWEVWARKKGELVKEWHDGDTDALVAWVRRWFEWATSRGRLWGGDRP